MRRHYGVRNERYKLIHFYNDVDAWELYDLKTDPTEMHNLYGRPGMEKVTREMKKNCSVCKFNTMTASATRRNSK